MAYQFAQSPSHSYLRTASAPAIAANLALRLWFKAADVTSHHTLIKIEYDDWDNNRILVQARGDVAGDPIRLVSQHEGTQYTLDTTTGYSANTWQHVLVGTGFTDNKMWLSLNGSAWVEKASVKGPSGSLSYIQIGGDNAFIPSIIGSIAEVALWGELVPYFSFDPQTNAKPLTMGFAPAKIRPGTLLFNAPLDGRLQDIRGGRTLTEQNGAIPANDHPPMRR